MKHINLSQTLNFRSTVTFPSHTTAFWDRLISLFSNLTSRLNPQTRAEDHEEIEEEVKHLKNLINVTKEKRNISYIVTLVREWAPRTVMIYLCIFKVKLYALLAQKQSLTFPIFFLSYFFSTC